MAEEYFEAEVTPQEGFQETPKTCPVCERLKEMCEEVGEGKFCNELMDKLKGDKITGEQFIDNLMANEKVAGHLQLGQLPT